MANGTRGEMPDDWRIDIALMICWARNLLYFELIIDVRRNETSRTLVGMPFNNRTPCLKC